MWDDESSHDVMDDEIHERPRVPSPAASTTSAATSTIASMVANRAFCRYEILGNIYKITLMSVSHLFL